MVYKTLIQMINIVVNNGVNLEFEDRVRLGYKTYNTFNHAEIKNFYNASDNMIWDAQVFGYDKPFKFNKIYKTNKLMGIIWIPNGNHKIILKLTNKGFSKRRFKNQLDEYIKNYKIKNNMRDVVFISNL